MKEGGLKERLLMWAVPLLGSWVLKFLHATMRVTFVNDASIREWLKGGGRVIVAFWHGKLLMMPFSYYEGPGMRTFSSHHRDAEFTIRTMRRFGIGTVRGSSRKGWLSGFKNMIKEIKAGYDLTITPDGPKGPYHKVKPGIVAIAARTGARIYPVSFNAKRKKLLKNWDKFLIPYPFNSGVYIYADPVIVDKNAGQEELELKQQELEDKLNAVDAEADAYFDKVKN